MSNKVIIERFFPIGVKRIFDYFRDVDLLERWMSPSEMVVRYQELDPVRGGRYAYELHGKGAYWFCEGHFEEINPFASIVTVDHRLVDSEGLVVSTNITNRFDFMSSPDGTRIVLTLEGFFNKEVAYASETAWQQRLSYLADLIDDEISGNIVEAPPYAHN